MMDRRIPKPEGWDEALTIKQASLVLRLSPHMISSRIREGEIPVLRAGSLKRIPLRELGAFIAREVAHHPAAIAKIVRSDEGQPIGLSFIGSPVPVYFFYDDYPSPDLRVVGEAKSEPLIPLRPTDPADCG